MNIREKALEIFNNLTDEQLETFVWTFTDEERSWDDIEEVEPDEWDKEMLANSKIDNDETISFDELIEKLGIDPDDLRD